MSTFAEFNKWWFSDFYSSPPIDLSTVQIAWEVWKEAHKQYSPQPQPELTDAKLDDIYLKVVGPRGAKLSKAYARAVIAEDRKVRKGD